MEPQAGVSRTDQASEKRVGTIIVGRNVDDDVDALDSDELEGKRGMNNVTDDRYDLVGGEDRRIRLNTSHAVDEVEEQRSAWAMERPR